MRTWEFLRSCTNLLLQLFLSISGTRERMGFVFTFHLICKKKILLYLTMWAPNWLWLPTRPLLLSADFCESHCTRLTPLPGISVKPFHPPLFGSHTARGCDLSLESAHVRRNKNKNSVVWLRHGVGVGGGSVVTGHSQSDSACSP